MGKDSRNERPKVTLTLKHGDGIDLFELIYTQYILLTQRTLVLEFYCHVAGIDNAGGRFSSGW